MTDTDQLQNQATPAEADMDEKHRQMVAYLIQRLPHPRVEDRSWPDGLLEDVKQKTVELEELQRKRGGRRPGRPRKTIPEAEQPGVGHP